MESGTLMPRAVIFDVYGTLLEPLGGGGVASRASTAATEAAQSACTAAVVRHHAVAHGRGIAHPEVYWPDVVGEAVAGLGAMDEAARTRLRAVLEEGPGPMRLRAGAAAVLRRLGERGVVLGLATNAQPYTRAELAAALRQAGADLGLELFDPALCFWSFENGFSKPDPHVFQCLTARLRGLGIRPGETLMVGDRLDHDIGPARAFGWRAWHLLSEPGADWAALGGWLEQPVGANGGDLAGA